MEHIQGMNPNIMYHMIANKYHNANGRIAEPVTLSPVKPLPTPKSVTSELAPTLPPPIKGTTSTEAPTYTAPLAPKKSTTTTEPVVQPIVSEPRYNIYINDPLIGATLTTPIDLIGMETPLGGIGGGGGGGGGAYGSDEEGTPVREKKSWLWLILIASGAYILLKQKAA